MRGFHCLFILFLLGWTASQAQPYGSTKGSFQVDQKLGCAPLTVNITQLINNSFLASYCYEGCSPVVATTNSKTHTFNQPGTYTVFAIYNGLIPNSTDNTDNITITVTENIQPEFEISNCSNSQVSIKVTETKYDQYLVDFNNDNTVDKTIPSGGTQSATFQYGGLGNQTITVRGRDNNGADNCSKKSHTITPLVALPAASIKALTVLDAASIQLNYFPDKNIQYHGQIAIDNATTFQIFQSFNSVVSTQQTLPISSLTTDSKYYCFRLNSFDPCNNTNVPSNIICSVNLNLNIVSNANQLSWTTEVTGINNYTIKRNQTDYQTTSGTNYNDNPPFIVCNTDYCYQIVSNYSNGTKSTSLEKCGTSFSSDIPTAIENVSSSFNAEELNLKWQSDPVFSAKSYSINRSQSGGPFNSIGSSTTTSYTDNSITNTETYCYNINYLDVCNNTSLDGNIFCPIVLSGFATSKNFVDLNWTEYNGWKNGVQQYQVIKFDLHNNQLASFTTTDLNIEDNLDDPDNQVVEYVVTAIPNDGGLTNSVSNRFRITKLARLIFPTAFTPNKDKLNDQFTVIGQYVENMTLEIFDRWGTLIFSTTKNEAWDGTRGGTLMPESVYIWKANLTDKTGKTSTQIGSVALLRKD